MALDANPPHDVLAGSEDRSSLPLDCQRFFVPESMVPASGELSTPRTWIPDRVPRAGMRIYLPEGPRRWLSPNLWGATSSSGAVPALAQSPASTARDMAELCNSEEEAPVPMLRREHAPRATRVTVPVALSLGIRAAQPPSTIWEGPSSPSSPDKPETAAISSPCSREEPLHIRDQHGNEAQDAMSSSPFDVFRRSTLTHSWSQPALEISTDGFRRSPCSDSLAPQRCCSLSEDGGYRQTDTIGRTMSTASRASCDLFTEKAIRGMTALETDIDELARMASQGEVSQQAQDFCLRVAERLKGEMASMENDLLDLCSVMEAEFEAQCQNHVEAEVEAYEHCLIAVHVEVCRLFDRANRAVDNSIQTSSELHDLLEKMQTSLFMSKLRTEQLMADKRVLQSELDVMRLENSSTENAATIKDEVIKALQQHKKTLADHQSDKDLALKGQIQALQRQLHEAMEGRDEARAKLCNAETLIEKMKLPAYSGQKRLSCAEDLDETMEGNAPHLTVLRELQATLRTSEAERNRLQMELVAKYEENSNLTAALRRSSNERLALEQEAAKLRNSLAERKGYESSGTSGGSTPPHSCHSQNPADNLSPSMQALSAPRVAGCVPFKARFLDESLSLCDPQAFKKVLTEDQAEDLRAMCDHLKCAQREVDSLRALPILCEVCNANVQRRWRPKGKMQQYLASKPSFLLSNTGNSYRSPPDGGYDDPIPKEPSASHSSSTSLNSSPGGGVDWCVQETLEQCEKPACKVQSSSDDKDLSIAKPLVAEKVPQRALYPSAGWQVFGETSPATRPAPAIFGESPKALNAEPSRK